MKDFSINDTQGSRRPARLKDQHGRVWFAEIDRISGFPAGLVRLEHRTPRGHTPPWEPDQGFLVFNRDDPFHVRIDYERMLAERIAAHDEYHKQALREATARGWEVPVEGKPYSPQITELIGRPPHPWQPIKAAMDGNSWILGFSDTTDHRLEPFVRKETQVEKLVRGLPDFSDEAPSRMAQAAEAVGVDLSEEDGDDEPGEPGAETSPEERFRSAQQRRNSRRPNVSAPAGA
jgi:hypothetical protein